MKKNLILALALIMTLGFITCDSGGGSSDDGRIDWSGMWVQVEDEDGEEPDDPYSFTLFDNGDTAEDGEAWEAAQDAAGGNVLLFTDEDGDLTLSLSYQRINRAKIRIIDNSEEDIALNGVYEKFSVSWHGTWILTEDEDGEEPAELIQFRFNDGGATNKASGTWTDTLVGGVPTLTISESGAVVLTLSYQRLSASKIRVIANSRDDPDLNGVYECFEAFEDMQPFDDSGPPDDGNSTIHMTVGEIDGHTSWQMTGNVTTRFQYGFTGWEYKGFSEGEKLEELKVASAISFMTKGDGKRYTVKYRLSSVTDHAHYEYHFIAPLSPTLITVEIGQFSQPNWGTTRPMNQALVEDVSWQTHEQWRPGNYDVTIWDIQIIP